MNHYFTIILFLVILPTIGKSYCYEDIYGNWKSLHGEFLELVRYDQENEIRGKTAIGNNSIQYSGALFFEENAFILSCNFNKKNDLDSQELNKTRTFKFRVVSLDKQKLIIKPYSDDLIKLFGKENLIFYNDNYITLEKFELENLYYTRLHIGFNIKITKDSAFLERYNFNNSKKNKYYKSKITKDQFSELKQLIFRSNIMTMSSCKMQDYSSDTYSVTLKIKANNLYFKYRRGVIHDSVYPLLNKLSELEKNLKWKRIKRKKQ